jgi:hypothetical protein
LDVGKPYDWPYRKIMGGQEKIEKSFFTAIASIIGFKAASVMQNLSM